MHTHHIFSSQLKHESDAMELNENGVVPLYSDKKKYVEGYDGEYMYSCIHTHKH